MKKRLFYFQESALRPLIRKKWTFNPNDDLKTEIDGSGKTLYKIEAGMSIGLCRKRLQ